MAKASWVKVTPSQGSGSATVNVSSVAEHTGRALRSTTLTWKAANVTDITRTVSQAGKPEYVDIQDAMAVPKEGKLVTLTGESNSACLTFSVGLNGGLGILLPETYYANSVEVANGEDIPGDPGAAAKYNFSISIEVPSNNGVTELSKQVIVRDEAGNEDICLITLAAGDAFLTVQTGKIELDYLGTPVAVQVESNTSWTIE